MVHFLSFLNAKISQIQKIILKIFPTVIEKARLKGLLPQKSPHNLLAFNKL
jgi:hypothetical protein